uniref:Putative secreted peptide n=1 Tax=Anopheles braziliensis TaxID=58242 RepID=A0A2M3ZX49_9DIPT
MVLFGFGCWARGVLFCRCFCSADSIGSEKRASATGLEWFFSNAVAAADVGVVVVGVEETATDVPLFHCSWELSTGMRLMLR